MNESRLFCFLLFWIFTVLWVFNRSCIGWLPYDKDAHNLNMKTFTYMTPKQLIMKIAENIYVTYYTILALILQKDITNNIVMVTKHFPIYSCRLQSDKFMQDAIKNYHKKLSFSLFDKKVVSPSFIVCVSKVQCVCI